MMPVQRVRDAENRMRNKLSNGPLRVQSNAIKCKVFCNVRHTLAAGDIIYAVKYSYVAKYSNVVKHITYPAECMA